MNNHLFFWKEVNKSSAKEIQSAKRKRNSCNAWKSIKIFMHVKSMQMVQVTK